MSWEPLLERYLDRLRSTGRAPATVKLYGSILADFAGFCGVEPAAVGPEHLAVFQQRLLLEPGPRKGRIYSVSHRYRILLVVAAFFRWAVDHQLLLLDPARDLELEKPRPGPLRLVSPRDMLAVLQAPDPSSPRGLRDRAFLATLYATAIRRRECHRLDLADYDRGDQSLAIGPAKGGLGRKVPVLPHLAELLEEYLDLGRPFLHPNRGERALFIGSQNGRRLGYSQLWNIVTGYGRMVGVQLTVHAIRHACATHVLAGGAKLDDVKALLGHARLESTQRYTAVQPQEIARTMRRSHPRGRRRTKPNSCEAGPA